jgi:hypothetical protein
VRASKSSTTPVDARSDVNACVRLIDARSTTNAVRLSPQKSSAPFSSLPLSSSPVEHARIVDTAGNLVCILIESCERKAATSGRSPALWPSIVELSRVIIKRVVIIKFIRIVILACITRDGEQVAYSTVQRNRTNSAAQFQRRQKCRLKYLFARNKFTPHAQPLFQPSREQNQLEMSMRDFAVQSVATSQALPRPAANSAIYAALLAFADSRVT